MRTLGLSHTRRMHILNVCDPCIDVYISVFSPQVGDVTSHAQADAGDTRKTSAKPVSIHTEECFRQKERNTSFKWSQRYGNPFKCYTAAFQKLPRFASSGDGE